MRCAVLLVCLVFAVGCAPRMPPELLGRWRSDEARTLADIDARGKFTPEQRARFEDGFFGELAFEFHPGGTYAWSLDDLIEISEYEVVEAGASFVDFIGYDALLERRVVKRVWIEGPDALWVWSGYGDRGFREYFRREP